MSQATLKLKSYASNVRIIDSGNLQKNILRWMLLALGALVLFYAFSLGNMVSNIIERKALESRLGILSNKVALLEVEYLKVSQKIDLSFAHSMGFKDVKTNFATRKYLGSINILQNEI